MSTASASLSPAQGIWLVAERELGSKLRSKSFIISTIILVVVALAGILWSGVAANQESTTPVAVTSEALPTVSAAEGLDITEVDDRAAGEKLVLDGEVDAAVVAGDGPTGVIVIAESSPPSDLVSMLSMAPEVELLAPDATPQFLRYMVAILFGLVFFMVAMTFGSTIAQSVVEEKQTRVVEILISAIPTRVLLAGKVLGNTVLAMGQIVLLAAVAVIGLVVTGQTQLLQGLGAPLVWFVVFFLFGFVLLAAMFASAGAMVSRQEDVGTTMSPLIYLVMAPYFLVIFLNDNPVAMTIMSYIPFSAPVGMPLRLFFGEAQWWEPLLSLVIMLATCVGVISLGAKIYENTLLRMGARVKFREALRG